MGVVMIAQTQDQTKQTAEAGWQDHLDSPLWAAVPAGRSGRNSDANLPFVMWTKAAARVDFAAARPHHIGRVAGIYRERRGQPRLMAEV